jgi:hypothetical protein
MDERANDLLKVHDKLVGDRGNWNVLWTQVAQRVAPNYDDFIKTWSPGQKKTDQVFDSTPVNALTAFCAAMESMLCPSSQRWHHLVPEDDDLISNQAVQMYLDEVNKRLFKARYAPQANFQSQVHEVFRQIGAFGNGPLLVDDTLNDQSRPYTGGLRYRVMHLAETFIQENSNGFIDWVDQEYKLSARNAVARFERYGKLHPELIKAAETDPQKMFGFVHFVYPNDEKRERNDFSFKSITVSREHRCIVKESGYFTQPIMFSRFTVNARESYGRGPGMDVLPDILMINEMKKSIIRRTQKVTEPPILTSDDGSLQAFDMRGNAINHGYMSSDGKPMVMELPMNSNGLEVGKELMQDVRNTINRAFFVDIFNILVEQTGGQPPTATEVLQRAQEKGYLLAPMVGRMQAELLGPMITRELDILERAGQLPPLPDVLAKRGGIKYKIVYESDIVNSQKQSAALSVSRVLQQITPLAQIDPRVLRRINADRTLKILAEANSAPAGMMNTDDEQEAMDQAEAQQQQLQNLTEMAGPASQAIKNIAQAQQAAGSVAPGNIVGGGL